MPQKPSYPSPGLKERPFDPRDYRLGAIIPIKYFPKLEDLPEEFELETSDLKDQIDDFCTGNVIALLIGTNEGFPCDENWSMAVSKQLSKDVEDWGQDLRTAMKVGVKAGALPKKDSPFTSDKGSAFLRRIENWPEELFAKAEPQKQKTYFEVTGPYSHFDNIRATIYYLKKVLKQKQGVGLGVLWSWPLSQYIMDDSADKGFGHAITGIGWKQVSGQPYLLIQNSYKDAGEKGRHLFNFTVIENFAERYGVYCYLDMPREEAEFLVGNSLTIESLWWVKIWLFIKKLFV